MSQRMDRLKKSGLIGCLNDTGVTSENHKKILKELIQSWMDDPNPDEETIEIERIKFREMEESKVTNE